MAKKKKDVVARITPLANTEADAQQLERDIVSVGRRLKELSLPLLECRQSTERLMELSNQISDLGALLSNLAARRYGLRCDLT